MYDVYDDFILLRNNYINGKLFIMRQLCRFCVCLYFFMVNMILRDSNSMVMLGKKIYKYQFLY